MKLTERYPSETNRDYALRMIRNNIISLDLVPGSLLSENELSKELAISRTPIREALIELSRVGIVEILPQRGSRIALIDYDLVEESRGLRTIVEKKIVELLCNCNQELNFELIEENLALEEFYFRSCNYAKLMEVDNNFHHLLYTLANREMTYQLVNDMNIHFDRVRELSLYTDDRTYLVDEHREIMAAIKNRDAKAAKEITLKHMSHYRQDKQGIIRKYPQFVKK